MVYYENHEKPFLKIFTSKFEAVSFLLILIVGGLFAFFKYVL